MTRGGAAAPHSETQTHILRLEVRPVLSALAASSAFRFSAPHLATGAVALQFGFGLMTVSDTIAAISTPPGEGAIALGPGFRCERNSNSGQDFPGQRTTVAIRVTCSTSWRDCRRRKSVDRSGTYFQSTVPRRVTPAKIWSRSVVTAARSFPRKFSKPVCVQGRERRVPANSLSARFSTAKWISPRPRR